jgi:hypothetical protein
MKDAASAETMNNRDMGKMVRNVLHTKQENSPEMRRSADLTSSPKEDLA